MPHKTWSEDRRQQAVDMYTSGKTLAEICHALTAGTSTVQKYLLAAGVQMRKAARRGTPKDRKSQIVECYLRCRSISQCCREMRTGPPMVKRALHEAGLHHDDWYWSEEEIDGLVAMYQEPGMSVREAARRMGTTAKTVRDQLRCRGVQIRPHSDVTRRGDRHPMWKGGRVLAGRYVYVHSPDHPHRTKAGYVSEHRLVMEQHLGRLLLPTEVVHHRNKNTTDNRVENLELFVSNRDHLASELRGQRPKWSEEGKARIDEGVQRWRAYRRNLLQTKTDDRQSP